MIDNSSAGALPERMTFRALQPADVASVAAMMAANTLWQRYGITHEAAARRLQSGLDGGATVVVAETSGVVVGFVWYVVGGAFQRSGYVMLIGVDPSRQRQGIGHALLDRAEAALFATAESILLLVSDFNTAAQSFYHQRGYVQVGAIPDYVIPGVCELILFKRRPSR